MNPNDSMVFKVVKLLYIEDSSDDIEFLRNEILSKIEDPVFEVQTAVNMADAEEKLKDTHYDVVLLDLHLPNGAGLSIVERTLNSAGGTPVVIVSKLEDDEVSRQAVKRGAQDYLIKGEFNARGFRRAITHALYRKFSARQKRHDLEQVKSQAIAKLQKLMG